MSISRKQENELVHYSTNGKRWRDTKMDFLQSKFLIISLVWVIFIYIRYQACNRWGSGFNPPLILEKVFLTSSPGRPKPQGTQTKRFYYVSSVKIVWLIMAMFCFSSMWFNLCGGWFYFVFSVPPTSYLSWHED